MKPILTISALIAALSIAAIAYNANQNGRSDRAYENRDLTVHKDGTCDRNFANDPDC